MGIRIDKETERKLLEAGATVGPLASLPQPEAIDSPFCFEQQCVDRGFMEPIAEYCFAPPRKFRFDWSWPEVKVALEVEGGVWTQGRHNRPKGFLADISKYNLAGLLGWRVFRTTPTDMKSGKVFELLTAIFKEKR